jgi:hypothetical protein
MYKIHENIYNYLIYASYILIFLVITGFSVLAPKYLDKLYNFLKLYIAIILIFKFNPFIENNKISEFDKKLIFSSSLFLIYCSSFFLRVKEYLLDLFEKYFLYIF